MCSCSCLCSKVLFYLFISFKLFITALIQYICNYRYFNFKRWQPPHQPKIFSLFFPVIFKDFLLFTLKILTLSYSVFRSCHFIFYCFLTRQCWNFDLLSPSSGWKFVSGIQFYRSCSECIMILSVFLPWVLWMEKCRAESLDPCKGILTYSTSFWQIKIETTGPTLIIRMCVFLISNCWNFDLLSPSL